jgi:hypothetical protein
VPKNERTTAEDEDPIFKILHTFTMSRHRARSILSEIERGGFVIVRKADLERVAGTAETKPSGFAAAVVAAAEKRN